MALLKRPVIFKRSALQRAVYVERAFWALQRVNPAFTKPSEDSEGMKPKENHPPETSKPLRLCRSNFKQPWSNVSGRHRLKSLASLTMKVWAYLLVHHVCMCVFKQSAFLSSVRFREARTDIFGTSLCSKDGHRSSSSRCLHVNPTPDFAGLPSPSHAAGSPESTVTFPTC